jgi:hypothetical protein
MVDGGIGKLRRLQVVYIPVFQFLQSLFKHADQFLSGLIVVDFIIEPFLPDVPPSGIAVKAVDRRLAIILVRFLSNAISRGKNIKRSVL